MSEEFGSGIFLDDQFDLSIDSTGDIQSTTGVDELQKDLAFQMVISMQQFRGSPPSGNLKAKISNTASQVVLGDSRINSVVRDSFTIEFSDNRESIDIRFDVRTETGQQTLVFNI